MELYVFSRKGCKYCPAYEAEYRGYRSCVEWAVFHPNWIINYVENWSEDLISEENK